MLKLATDADAAEAEAGRAAVDRQARLVTQQVLDVLHQVPVHLLAVDHIDRGGHITHRTLGAGGGDLHAIKFARVGRGGGSGGSVGGQRQGHPDSKAKGGMAGHRFRSTEGERAGADGSPTLSALPAGGREAGDQAAVTWSGSACRCWCAAGDRSGRRAGSGFHDGP
ncbi:hypothetical protein G6F22_017517 [Rhizopus arrhizus]|nr:hypothetical protein G6F22_017517 [Rhizopus arrhizus]